jgi:deoxycytidine triphosphate deaminase
VNPADHDLKTQRQREKERLVALHSKCPRDDQEFPYTGVLLSDAIEYCVDKFDLIRPFEKENLKPANYKLTIGDKCAKSGEILPLSDEAGQNQITIRPFEVAIIKTRETINMPNFLIGRWNIRVQLAYKGLLWVGGPQVDAGYVGHLFCPVYNLSDKKVVLHYAEPIAVIDFVRTSAFKKGESKEYQPIPPDRLLIEDYEATELKSALYTMAVSKLESSDKRMDALQGRIDNFVSITFAVVGLLFAAVTLFFGKSQLPNWWDPSVFWVCALAIVVSMFAWVNSKSSVQWFSRPWHRILFEVFIFALVVATIVGFSRRTQSKVGELAKQVEKLRDQVSQIAPSSPTGASPTSPAAKQQLRQLSAPDGTSKEGAPSKK